MKNLKYIGSSLVIALSLGFSGCGGGSDTPSSQSEWSVFQESDSSIFIDSVAQGFDLNLKTNATSTGYVWNVMQYDTTLFKTPTVINNQSNMVDASAIETWRFAFNDIALPEQTSVTMQNTRLGSDEIPLNITYPINIADAYPLASYTEQHTAITLHENERRFKIVLNANPTTGYSWNLSELDSNLFKTPYREYKSEGDMNIVGSGGKESWYFQLKERANRPANTFFSLSYAQNWEGGMSDRNITFNVSIE